MLVVNLELIPLPLTNFEHGRDIQTVIMRRNNRAAQCTYTTQCVENFLPVRPIQHIRLKNAVHLLDKASLLVDDLVDLQQRFSVTEIEERPAGSESDGQAENSVDCTAVRVRRGSTCDIRVPKRHAAIRNRKRQNTCEDACVHLRGFKVS